MSPTDEGSGTGTLRASSSVIAARGDTINLAVRAGTDFPGVHPEVTKTRQRWVM